MARTPRSDPLSRCLPSAFPSYDNKNQAIQSGTSSAFVSLTSKLLDLTQQGSSLVLATSARLVSLPPLIPNLDPTEQVFAELKRLIRRLQFGRSKKLQSVAANSFAYFCKAYYGQ